MQQNHTRPHTCGTSHGVTHSEPHGIAGSRVIKGTVSTGERLSAAMSAAAISNHELCRRTGLAYSTVRRVLSGDRIGALDTWLKISDAIGMNILDLLEYEKD